MRTVGLVIFDGVRAFDYAVVAEVWGSDRRSRGVPPFDLRVCGPGRRPVRLGSGLSRTPDRGLAGLRDCDLVVVPGIEAPSAPGPPAVLDALRRAHAGGTPVAALCAGAFVLAAAGLLDGRRATTHWWLAPELAERHPEVTVEPEVLFVGDGRVWTSAGVAAGIDLCLHLVREAHGSRAAAAIARAMVTAPFRTGGQAQFIVAPVPAGPNGSNEDEDPIGRVREEALNELARPLTVAQLARRAAMSERTFARRFTESTGSTPLRWLLEQRVLAARRLLEEGDATMEEIARRCGFGSPVSLRQHFARHVGVSPREYRRAYRGRSA